MSMDTKNERKPKWWHGGKFPGNERKEGLALAEFAEDGGSNSSRTRVDSDTGEANADRYYDERGSGEGSIRREADLDSVDREERIPLAMLGVGAAFVGALLVGTLVGTYLSRRNR
jgi:hypothetical protein